MPPLPAARAGDRQAYVKRDDDGVEVGVHEASKVDVATSNASFGALVMSPCGHTARSNTKSTI